MDKSPDKIEKTLNDIDFSRGHEGAVWDKIHSRLQTPNQELCLDELDDVAGGLSKPHDENDNTKNPYKK